jgi:mannan endo-1,4-beta-mannosidase
MRTLFFFFLLACAVARAGSIDTTGFPACRDDARALAVDKRVTAETASLLYRLLRARGEGTLVGQQDGAWLDADGRVASRFAPLAGKHPGIVSYDFLFIANRRHVSAWHRARERATRANIIAANAAGIAVTMCWHYNDPYTGATFYAANIADRRARNDGFRSILPGGVNHEVYRNDLRTVARFFASLRDARDRLVPVIFRPFHECDGDWFWWGAPYCTPDEFKQLWRFTVTYLRDSLGVHNLLYAYSPDAYFDTPEEYLARYPGDDFVDILGVDDYRDFKHDERQANRARERLAILTALARDKRKPAALTETAYFVKRDSAGARDVARLRRLLAVVEEATDLAYVSFWGNGGSEYCVPGIDDPGAAEFAAFLRGPGVLLAGDRPGPVRLAVLPDVQTYTRLYPEIFHAQTRWIAEHADDFHFVIQQGDITDWNAPEQWQNARDAFARLDGLVPYTFVPGNHDIGNNADVRNTDNFNRYFPIEKYAGMPAFGGALEPGKMDNTWHEFRAGGIDWLVLSLEFAPRNAILARADSIIRARPRHKVIVNTHAYMYSDNTRIGAGDDWNPHAYGVGSATGDDAVNDGEEIWEKLVSRHANVFMVLSGHVLHSGAGTLVSRGIHGNAVYQMLANYQWGVDGTVNGGNGFARVITIDVKAKSIRVETYSPYINAYDRRPAHDFTFDNVEF